ncbi:VIT domain-containing protein [Labilithrix luteola]|uniref:VIT domain-containing protein n=1 Tax=Labilithrix luteola TaxID=1391654 RepID=UPI0014761212|nr:VIT domain-containing protein [Labilithrix luteola]
MPPPSIDHEPCGADMETADGRSLPLVSAHLRVETKGGLARAVLEQVFENPYEETLKVTYRMPLPADGSVSGYAFEIGARTVAGRVDRKAAARETFEKAILEGKTSALLEQERADVFTQSIGNIPSRQRITARITMDLRLAWRTEGEWELRFPTVIGPRYVGATETPEDAAAVHVDVAEKGVRARIGLELAVGDVLSDGRRVESPSHSLRTRDDGVIELASGAGERLDRDIVVRWAVVKPSIGASLAVARPAATSPHGRHGYGLLTVVPPSPDAGMAAQSRDLVVLLDTSGSMSGGPLTQAKRVVGQLIESLGEADRFELVEFSSRPTRYAHSPIVATREAKKKAIAWVMGLEAQGGTEMYSGIVEALTTLRAGAQRQVVLLTDGYVGGEKQLITLLHERLPEGCRMHVVGVGAAVNRSLSTAIARAGRGAEILVGLSEDAEKACRVLLDRTCAPILTDVTITGDALVEMAPEALPDVFAGAPLLAALKLNPNGGELVIRGKLARGTWEERVHVAPIAPSSGERAVTALYALERVADLEVRWTMGEEAKAVDREIESLGVVFQISTRMTSWVAVDDAPSVDPQSGSRSESVPQELPFGTSLASFGLGSATLGFGGAPPAAAMPMSVARPMSAPVMQMPPSPAPRGPSGPMRKRAAFAAPPPAEGESAAGAAPQAEADLASVVPQASSGGAPAPARKGEALPAADARREALVASVPKRRTRLWLVALVLLILVLLALAAWLLGR